MTYNLDDKDWKIINILKEHGDYATRQIAKKTLLPVTTIHHRIKRLKEEKIIRKFTIDLDPIKTEKGWLLIYHGTQEQNIGRNYRCGAALFDLKKPELDALRHN